MAQGCVGCASLARIKELDFVGVAATNAQHPLWQGGLCGLLTLVMRGRAYIELAFYEPEALVRV